MKLLAAAGAALLLAACSGTASTTGAPAPTTGAATPVLTASTAPTASATTASSAGGLSPVPGVATATGCGVNNDAKAVGAAIMAQPIEPKTSSEWSMTPLEGTYDPCVTLTAVVITIERGTGSSPEQVLLFHRGEYVGTTTKETHSFMSLAKTASTDTTVAVDYRTGQSCTACSDGTVTRVTYTWDGSKVVMSGTVPSA